MNHHIYGLIRPVSPIRRINADANFYNSILRCLWHRLDLQKTSIPAAFAPYTALPR